MKLDVKLPDDMGHSPRTLIRKLLVGRFMCRPKGPTTLEVSPLTYDFFSKHEVPVDPTTSTIALDLEWTSYRKLDNWEWQISKHRDIFSDELTQLMQNFESTIERYTGQLTNEEYRILLVYGGRAIYDFFVFDHRFGAPPRGRDYRSNLRGEWIEKVGDKAISRPDNALLQLRAKIRRARASGVDTSDLEREYARREDCVRRGVDWRESNVVPIRNNDE